MLASGAKHFYWLQVWRTHPEEGITALLDMIGDNAVSVCESNSLRQFVEPGLFIMVKGCGEEKWKSSAKNIAQHADKIIFFDVNKFDIDADETELINDRWVTQNG